MNVMIDTETMSTRPDAAVASLGAVTFTTERVENHNQVLGQPGLTYPWPEAAVLDAVKFPNNLTHYRWFYANLDLREQTARHFDPDTLYWWLQQGDAARTALLLNIAPVREALEMFIAWYRAHNPEQAWAYGANFDHPILDTLFKAFGLTYPPTFREQLCARTIVKVTRIALPPSNGGVLHSALSDAINQAIWMQHAREQLMKGGNG